MYYVVCQDTKTTCTILAPISRTGTEIQAHGAVKKKHETKIPTMKSLPSVWSNCPTLLVQHIVNFSLIKKNKEVVGENNDVESGGVRHENFRGFERAVFSFVCGFSR